MGFTCGSGRTPCEGLTAYGRKERTGVTETILDGASSGFRFLVFDYKDPFMGSFVLEGAMMIAILKPIKWAVRAGDAAKLSRKLGSEEGVAELMSGGGKAIAGAGTKVPLRDSGRLVNEYGGKASEWAKVSSTSAGRPQTHAYRNISTGQVVELKSNIQ